MEITYVKLDYATVAKDSHLALREFVNWFCSKEDITRGFGEMEGEGEKYIKDPRLMRDVVSNMVMPAMIQNDPRKLYEFLDEHNIRISIAEHPDSLDERVLFTYHNSMIKESKTASNRCEAEQNAFYDAMNLLHKQIEGGNKT